MSNFTDFLATPPAASGKVSRVATGSITAGNPVQINSDGTVSIPAAILSTSASGSTEVVYDAYQNLFPKIEYLPNIDRYLAVYIGSSTSRYMYGRIGAPNSDGSITWGSQILIDNGYGPYYYSFHVKYHPTTGKVYVIGSNNSQYNYGFVLTVTTSAISVGSPTSLSRLGYPETSQFVYDSTNDKFVLIGINATTGNLCAYVITISGTTSSVGALYNFGYGSDNYGSAVYDPVSGKIAFFDRYASDCFVQLGTISGTDISFESRISLGLPSTHIGMTGAASYSSDSNKIIYVYYNTSTGGAPYAKLVTISGSSVSTGSQFTLTDLDSSYQLKTIYDNQSGAFAITWTNPSIGSRPYVATISYSGSTITAIGTPTALVSFAGYNPFFAKDTSRNRYAIIYANNGSNHYSSTATFGSASMTANNFLGFAESSVSNGQTLNVTVVGGVNSNQSGLTTGSKYYASGSSTSLSTSGTIAAGIALSATSILTKG